LQRLIDEKGESLYDKRSASEDLNVQINDLQIDLKNYEFQRDNLNQKLTEIYGATLEEVKNEFGDEQANKEEVARLKRLMEGLGAINQAAPEEYDEKEQRYNFLIEQQKDLLSSRDDLQNIIRKINDSTVENFKKTFDLVRENFQKVYSRLFDGGDADLRLVDESNLLETGIEIFVQPPGKKFQSISSYSGGEKALTAVALLFAFFMVKASPFCILDEVDTSLDEANLVKYNKAVREFAKNIQFLVITHQNISMENVDVLYGVTQEEQGVSTIISAKLAKSEQSAE
jgi:chromosome segregation protein